jgi:hypothetical protein
MTVSNAQKAAIKRWNEKNKEKRNYYTRRSMARGFIKNNATEEDLKELSVLIKERRAELLK